MCFAISILATADTQLAPAQLPTTTDSWVSLWLSRLLMYGVEIILSVPRAPHVSSTIGAGTVFFSVETAKALP